MEETALISVSDSLLKIARKVSPIETIYDCGSRDAQDGLYLLESLQAKELHIFECNPASVEKCRQNVRRYVGKGAIFVNDMAVSDSKGTLPFFAIDTGTTITSHPDGNPGASSLYRANPGYKKERYVQREMTVTSTTLDEYALTHAEPDLLWMDLQGAELSALQGAAGILSKVRLIHTEIAFRPVYLGQPLFWTIDAFLKRGFDLVHLNVGRWPKIPWLYKLSGKGPWFGDAIYVNRSIRKPNWS